METIYDKTVETARQIEDLKMQLKTLEFNKQKKLVELRNIKKEVSAIQANSDVLVTRDIALREKFNELDETVRGASELVSKDTKRFFKKLGLKVKIEEIPDNLLELEIKFVESRDHSATFVYDSVTEDYDLIAIQPEHPKFRELREFLRQTKDIQGFLYNLRKNVIGQLNKEN